MRYVIKRKSKMATDTFTEVEGLPGVQILDRVGKWAALVEADEAIMEAHLSALSDWTVAPEAAYNRPELPQFSVTPNRRD